MKAAGRVGMRGRNHLDEIEKQKIFPVAKVGEVVEILV